jgi:hypothetical protein
MAIVTGLDVAAFLGKSTDPATVAHAGQQVPIVTAMARAYTRGKGFDDDGAADDLAAVIVTATARMMVNPAQIAQDHSAGPYTESIRGGFTGWSLAETFVLNRYRKRAQ